MRGTDAKVVGATESAGDALDLERRLGTLSVNAIEIPRRGGVGCGIIGGKAASR